MFVFFETNFFSRLPNEEKCYAIPVELSKNNSFKRYGYHGIFHEYNAELVSSKSKLISIVFDNKTTVCSALARNPYSISLGYTPLEGIMSASSCGDLDSGIVFYLMKRYGNSLFKIDDILKRQSGFYGLTGYDLKISELIKLYGKDNKVTLAFDVYRNQILKYVGEAISVLGGLDHLIISGSEIKTFLPIIYKLLNDISFLGINLKCLPWSEDSAFVELTTHESDIKVSINYQTVAEIIARKTIKIIKAK
jgi:acetate kinase